MKKGDIRVKRKKNSKEVISFEPRLSTDKRTFVVRVENGTPDHWANYLYYVYEWAKQEIEDLQPDPDGPRH